MEWLRLEGDLKDHPVPTSRHGQDSQIGQHILQYLVVNITYIFFFFSILRCKPRKRITSLSHIAFYYNKHKPITKVVKSKLRKLNLFALQLWNKYSGARKVTGGLSWKVLTAQVHIFHVKLVFHLHT